MSLAPSQILGTATEEQIVAILIAALQELGFRTTSWIDGAIQKTLLRAVARTAAANLNTFGQVLDRLLVNPAGENSGAWQDIVGTYWYQLPRLEAVRTVRGVVYTSAASAPSHTITDGSLFTAHGQTFQLDLGVPSITLLPGASTAVLTARALIAGTAGNVASAAACALVTPYAGVTAALSGDPTTNGTARETNTRYQTRLDLRWAELTYSVGLRAYELWALTADGSINRVRAWSNYPDPNAIMVAIEPGDAGQLANATAYFAARSAVNDLPTAVAATPNTQTISASPRVRVGTSTVAEIEAAITAYLDAMKLGGVRIAGATAGRLLPEAITRVVLCGLPGVESFSLALPAAPVVLGGTDYVVPTYDITPEWVP